MSHDKIKAAARERMARTGEPYATARRRVITERMAEDGRTAAATRLSDPAVSAAEIRAAAAAHGELGPEYSDAVVASFLEKVEEEIAARVDASLGQAHQREPAADQEDRRTLLRGIAIGIGIGCLASIAVGGNPDERNHRVVLLLLILAVICAAGAARAVWRKGNRGAGRQRSGAAAVPGQNRR
jgi:hypothetical protein